MIFLLFLENFIHVHNYFDHIYSLVLLFMCLWSRVCLALRLTLAWYLIRVGSSGWPWTCDNLLDLASQIWDYSIYHHVWPFICVCVCVYVCACFQVPTKVRMDIGFLGVGVAGICELPNFVGAGIWGILIAMFALFCSLLFSRQGLIV